LLQGYDEPEEMYVSVHDAGAFYRFDRNRRKFVFNRQEVRKGFLQKPKFPEVVHLTDEGNHPVLFAAKGSHGLWTAPGQIYNSIRHYSYTRHRTRSAFE